MLLVGWVVAVLIRVLTGHRRDLADDRTRVINRLHNHLTSIFPALDRALDLTRVRIWF